MTRVLTTFQVISSNLQTKFVKTKNSKVKAKMYSKRSRELATLTRELEAQICAVRAEYDDTVTGQAEEEESRKTQSGQTIRFIESKRGAIDLIGPDFSIVQLVSNERIVGLLSSHAIGDACGSRLSLTKAENESTTEVEDVWVGAEHWRRPSLWVRESRFAVELDASSLLHWSQSLLIPENGPLSSSLNIAFFHPSRGGDDVDQQFINDFQSVFDMCGFGKTKVVCVEGFKVESPRGSSWDATARNLGCVVSKWVSSREGNASLMMSNSNTIMIIAWPQSGWQRARSALAACGETIPSNLVNKITVRIIPEEDVLNTRLKKSKLIAMSFGTYSQVSSRLPATLPITPEIQESNRIHIACSTSLDGQWLAYSWCDARGELLCCAARPNMNSSNVLSQCLQDVFKKTEGAKSSRFVVLLDKDSPLFTPNMDDSMSNGASIIWCRSDSVVFQSFSNDDQHQHMSFEDDLIRKELDDLAFLATALESPSRGPVSNMLAGYLAQKQDFDVKMHLPLHLRCAKIMASYLNGLVVPQQSNMI